MTISTVFRLELTLSEGACSGGQLGHADPWEGKNNQQAEGGTFRRCIPAGAVNVEVPILGLSAARLIAIKTDQAITVKKNINTGEAWTIRPLGTGALDGIFFCTTDEVTDLFFSNLGSIDAQVTISLAGTLC